MTIAQPTKKPKCPNFSSGPCTKYPTFNPATLPTDILGRSHRSTIGKKALKDVIDRTRTLLNIPTDYKIAIVPAGDTGAIEMAFWNMLGATGVDVYCWEAFGNLWADTIQNHLNIPDTKICKAPFGKLPELIHTPDRDCVFTYNGTTSGVKIPNTDWIHSDRTGLTICDATSAIFSEHFDWDKLDVTTWSWQKALGGEGAHGVIVLSPRALKRLETFIPPYPIPKILRLTKNTALDMGVFEGLTINTPSMMCVADVLCCYDWIDSIGGLDAIIQRCKTNSDLIKNWVQKTPWTEFLCDTLDICSNTSLCFKIVPENATDYIHTTLEKMDIAYDIKHHKAAPKSLRIWCGATVQSHDIECLIEWLEWAKEMHSLEQNNPS